MGLKGLRVCVCACVCVDETIEGTCEDECVHWQNCGGCTVAREGCSNRLL